jgi:regulator of protease activity HflC (stomatin/prohibitin superfamily)
LFWLVAAVILGIAFWVGVAFAVFGDSGTDERGGGIVAAIIAGVLFVVVSLFCSMHLIGQRQVGIVYNFSGTITGKKDAGTVVTWPWQHVKTENIGIQHEEFDLGNGNSAVSEDQQPIYAKLFINFQVDPNHVVDLYKRVGPNWKNILLDARVLQDFKEITANFTAPQLIVNREALRQDTKKRLITELARYDITVVDVFVKNLSFTDDYQRAIEAKQVQKQLAARAEAKVEQVKAEAEQAVAQAKGEAQAIAIKGKALHDHPEILRLTAIEKLNPNVQVIYTPQGANLFLPAAPSGK